MDNKASRSSEETVAPNPNRTWLAYAVAGVTFAAALGNMFLGGRIRNVMKAEMPRNPSSFRSTGTNHANTNSKSNASSSNSSSSFHGKINSVASFIPFNDHQLQLLGISQSIPRALITEEYLKQAYFQQARLAHPDSLPPDTSDQVREAKTKQFQILNSAYKELIEVIKWNKQISGSPMSK